MSLYLGKEKINNLSVGQSSNFNTSSNNQYYFTTAELVEDSAIAWTSPSAIDNLTKIYIFPINFTSNSTNLSNYLSVSKYSGAFCIFQVEIDYINNIPTVYYATPTSNNFQNFRIMSEESTVNLSQLDNGLISVMAESHIIFSAATKFHKNYGVVYIYENSFSSK